MGGLDHTADDSTEKEHAPTVARNARYGMALFVVYLMLYAGFVFASAFGPAWMALRPWAGVNVAIWYGFGLIFSALLVALVYCWLCRGRERP